MDTKIKIIQAIKYNHPSLEVILEVYQVQTGLRPCVFTSSRNEMIIREYYPNLYIHPIDDMNNMIFVYQESYEGVVNNFFFHDEYDEPSITIGELLGYYCPMVMSRRCLEYPLLFLKYRRCDIMAQRIFEYIPEIQEDMREIHDRFLNDLGIEITYGIK